jgi:hypothetical protein
LFLALLGAGVEWGLERFRPLVEEYRAFVPQALPPTAYRAYPESCRITDIPWTPEKKAYCATVSFQMALAALGQKQSLDTVNWLTGYTYGAFYERKSGRFYFGSHTNPGIQFAAPLLGVSRQYYFTGTAQEFVRAIKSFVSHGQPVEVSLNSATLVGVTGSFAAHSELITGFDEHNFFVYETSQVGQSYFVKSTPIVGNLVPIETIVQAVEQLADRTREAARYTFTVFDSSPKTGTWADVWKRNGALTQGKSSRSFEYGAMAIQDFGAQFSGFRPSQSDVAEDPEFIFEWGRYARADNAAFIRASTTNDSPMRFVATLFDDASAAYQQAWNARHDPARVREQMQLASEKETLAGELMIRFSDTPTTLPVSATDSKSPN